MSSDKIDSAGFRSNVGIIISNKQGNLLLAGRQGGNGWQFPQGGVSKGESVQHAMYRELEEELGLTYEHVTILGQTSGWMHYRLPDKFIRKTRKPVCIGQKQLWFLLRFDGPDNLICLTKSNHPEFDRWRWANFWEPLDEVIYFKRKVYAKVLTELGPIIFPQGLPSRFNL